MLVLDEQETMAMRTTPVESPLYVAGLPSWPPGDATSRICARCGGASEVGLVMTTLGTVSTGLHVACSRHRAVFLGSTFEDGLHVELRPLSYVRARLVSVLTGPVGRCGVSGIDPGAYFDPLILARDTDASVVLQLLFRLANSPVTPSATVILAHDTEATPLHIYARASIAGHGIAAYVRSLYELHLLQLTCSLDE